MRLIKIHHADTVAVAPYGLTAGENGTFAGGAVTARENIPAGHKIALRAVQKGETVCKYGYPIGVATCDIAAGAWVHTHNLRSDLHMQNNVGAFAAAGAGKKSDVEFMGYRRQNGAVGTRNDILILPTVGCAVRAAEKLAAAFTHKAFQGKAITALHPYGCSQLGEDAENTAKVLGALAHNPNFGGVLVVSLGCENNNLAHMEPYIRDIDPARIRYLVLQDCANEQAEGLRLLGELADTAAADTRTACPLRDLTVGVKCGGSDGLSGITANPVVGVVSDTVAGSGGAVLMTEVPETFGAEQLLAARCETDELRGRVLRAVSDCKRYFSEHGEPIGENPSPGNKEGGITTNEEKSLGCVLKSGHTPICDVTAYGERAQRKGVTLVYAPGNDAVSLSALAAAGATVVLFTTGRGTPLGSPVPVLKIATNAALYAKKPHWTDFDASVAIEEGCERTGERLTELLLQTASGQQTQSERAGHTEFSVWKSGVTL